MQEKILSKAQLLEMIQNKKVDTKEGLRLLKKFVEGEKDDKLIYFKPEWEKIPIKLSETVFHDKNILIVVDGVEVRDQFLALLRKNKNTDSNVVIAACTDKYSREEQDSYRWNPKEDMYGRRLLKDLEKDNLLPADVIYLQTLSTVKSGGESIDAVDKGILVFLNLACAASEIAKKASVQFLYLYTYQEEVLLPDKAINGFGRSLEMENPRIHFGTVGIKTDPLMEKNTSVDVSGYILSRCNLSLAEYKEVRIQGEDFFAKKLRLTVPAERLTYKAAFKKNGVYIITGGRGGLGKKIGKYLAQSYQSSLIFIGRTDVQTEEWEFLEQIRLLGGDAAYIQADISKKEDVNKILSETMNKFGSISGIIHAAGIVKDSFLMNKNKKDADAVMAAKVSGTVYLDELSKDIDLDFIMYFSSAAALIGNPGQCDYAYANGFMDSYCEYREDLCRRGKRKGKTLTVNWPLWEDGGMQVSDAVKSSMHKNFGIKPLPFLKGLRAMEEMMQSDYSQIMPMYGDAEKIVRALSGKSERSDEDDGDKKLEVQEIQLRIKTLELIKGIMMEALKIPENKISSYRTFQEYGVDSITVEHFNLQLEEYITSFPKTLLFEYDTIDSLCDFLVKTYKGELNLKFFDVPAEQSDQPFAGDTEQGTQGRTVGESSKSESDIAIIGLAGRYPDANDLNRFWINLTSGKDCIGEVPSHRWDKNKYYNPDSKKAKEGKMYTINGGFLSDEDKFDYKFFQISPREAETMDPQERLFLETAWEVIEDAGYTRGKLKKSYERNHRKGVGVFVGITTNTYLLNGPVEWEKGNIVFPNSFPWSAANRVSYLFDFHGPSMPVDTACSSSLTAIHVACESIKKGECGMAVAGGVNLYLHPMRYVGLCNMNMLSPTGKCHSFGEKGDGFVPGEGVGAVLLKGLSEAVRDGDHIYGVIKGTAVNHGGAANGYTVPNPNAQADLIKNALEKSNINPRTISYLEAHGTGTALGDPIEISGLSKAYDEYSKDKQYCAIGSVKSNIGHLESASGIAGLTKVLLQMKYQKLVPSLNAETLNPKVNFKDSPFYVQRELAEWNPPFVIENGVKIEYPRRAGISSFGAGGSNAHVIVEEYTGKPTCRTDHTAIPRLFLLSAKNSKRLKEYAEKINRFLEIQKTEGEQSFFNIAYTLQTGREAGEERLAVLADNVEDLKNKIDFYMEDKYSEDIYTGRQVFERRDEPSAADEAINTAMENRNLRQLAKLWIQGREIDWELLYVSQTPGKVSLPTYPFEKTKCWVDISKKELNSEIKKENYLHPLVDSNESTYNRMRFKKKFNGNEFYIKDHVNMLPAVAYLEFVRAAGSLAANGRSVTEIRNAVFISPVFVRGQAVEVFAEFNISTDDTAKFKVITGQGSEETVHAEGYVNYVRKRPDGGSTIKIREIEERCMGGEASARQYYEHLASIGAGFGHRFMGIQKFFYNDREALSYVNVPKELEGELKQYVLHPTMTDGALQTVVAWAYMTGANEERIYLPFVIDSMRLYKKDFRICYAYATRSGKNHLEEKHKVLLLDVQGETCVEISGYSIREMQRLNNEIVELKNIWNKKEIKLRVYEGNHQYLLFDFNEDLRIQLAREIAVEEKDILLVCPGDKYEYRGNGVYSIRPEQYTDFEQLTEDLILRKHVPFRVINNWMKEKFDTRQDKMENQLQFGFLSLMYMTKSWMKANLRGISLVSLIIKEKREWQPLFTAIDGFCKTVNAENKSYRYHTVIVNGFDSSVSRIIVSELDNADAGNMVVMYEENIRYVKEPVEVRLQNKGSHPLKAGGTYLITGGLGKIGRLMARFLQNKYRANLILVGRTELTQEGDSFLKELQCAGTEVLYRKADIADEKEAAGLAEYVDKRCGHINGIIHCAGIIKDSRIINKDFFDIESVIKPKIFGTMNLWNLFQDKELDFMAFFSSISASGNAGQSDYAYANRFMDEFAGMARENLKGCDVISINWPNWEEGGMRLHPTEEENLFQTKGLRTMSTQEGISIFEDVLSSGEGNIAVLTGNAEKIRHSILGGDTVPESVPLSDASEEVEQALIKNMINIIGEVLKMEPEEISANESLGSFGFDSITFTELSNKINEEFELSITPAIFFGHSTVCSVAKEILYADHEKLSTYYGQKVKMDGKVHKSYENEAERIVYSETRGKSESGNNSQAPEAVAIIGMSGVMPQSGNPEEFWNNIIQGKDLVTEIPKDRWDWKEYYGDPDVQGKTNIKWGGFMREVDKFDPMFFKILPIEAEQMDPQERIALEIVWGTIEDAGYKASELSGEKIGVYMGVSNADYMNLMTESNNPVVLTHSMLANRISYIFNFSGPSEPIDTACSSSLVAIKHAVDAILNGEVKMAVAGGINVILSPKVYMYENRTGMLSRDGRCKTFDQDANGYVRGEGAGALLLKPLSSAKEDGDHIYGVIRGISVNHGGHATSLTAPNPDAQAEVIYQAWNKTGIDPSRITYIETHGTGTSLGDPIEIEGLKKAFNMLDKSEKTALLINPHCGLGTVKTNIGHLESASGIAGIMKILLALKHNKLPRILHFKKQNPFIKLDNSCFYLVTETKEWGAQKDKNGEKMARCAGVSSFGIGGVNVHVAIEEYMKNEECKKTSSEEEIIVLSAVNEDRLMEYTAEMVDFISVYAEGSLSVGKCENKFSNLPVYACEYHTNGGNHVNTNFVVDDILKLTAEMIGIEQAEIEPQQKISDYMLSPVELMKLIEHIYEVYGRVITVEEINISSLMDIVEILTEKTAGLETWREDAGELADQGDNINLRDLAYTLQVGREEFPERIAFVVSGLEELYSLMKDFIHGEKCKKGMYTGRVSKTKNMDAKTGIAIKNKDLKELAALWTEGAEINWKELYEQDDISSVRISLPTYPFARDKYWFQNQPDHYQEETKEEIFLHPLIERNITTFEEQEYATRLKGTEFYLKDHMTGGVKILPGAVYLEMAYSAFELAAKHVPASIGNVIWVKPLTVGEMQKEVYISLIPAEDGAEFEVYTEDENKNHIIHSNGFLRNENGIFDENEVIDLPGIIDSMNMQIDKGEFYEQIQQTGIKFGPSFHSITRLYAKDAACLAEIVLPEHLSDAYHMFHVHPVMLDGAFQAVSWLMNGRYLPFSLESLETMGNMPQKCFAYVVYRANNQNSGIKEYDIKITDENGAVIINIRRYSVKEYRGQVLDTDLPTLLKRLEVGELSADEVSSIMEEIQ